MGSYRSYSSLEKLQPWYLSFRCSLISAFGHNCSLGVWVCSERPAHGQNPLMMIVYPRGKETKTTDHILSQSYFDWTIWYVLLHARLPSARPTVLHLQYCIKNLYKSMTKCNDARDPESSMACHISIKLSNMWRNIVLNLKWPLCTCVIRQMVRCISSCIPNQWLDTFRLAFPTYSVV